MPLLCAPVYSVFIVCCLRTMVNCFQSEEKKKSLWQDSKHWEMRNKLRGIHHAGICCWGKRETQMVHLMTHCRPAPSHYSFVFFFIPMVGISIFFFISLGKSNMVKRECFGESVDVTESSAISLVCALETIS